MQNFKELSESKMLDSSKEIIHSLYNNISDSKKVGFEDIKEVLLKVYLKLDINEDNNIPQINRLLNYLYFTSYTNNLTFSAKENELIKKLSEIGRYAGLNGVYRSDYGDKSQF